MKFISQNTIMYLKWNHTENDSYVYSIYNFNKYLCTVIYDLRIHVFNLLKRSQNEKH